MLLTGTHCALKTADSMVEKSEVENKLVIDEPNVDLLASAKIRFTCKYCLRIDTISENDRLVGWGGEMKGGEDPKDGSQESYEYVFTDLLLEAEVGLYVNV